MKIQRVLMSTVRFLALLFCVIGGAGSVWAQNFPDEPILLIVPFPPGGTTDIVARIVADGLGKELGQQVLVQNKAGLGGSLGTMAVVQANNDGYTLGMASNSTHIANPLLFKETTYDPMRDFTFLGGIGSVANVLVVNPQKLPAKNMADLLSLVQKNPKRYSCASAGSGSMGHLWLATFEFASKVDIPHAPFRGAAPALDSLLAGQADMMFDNLPSVLPHIKEGRLTPVAVASSKRLEFFPDVPTFGELGLESSNLDGWFGLVGPVGIPTSIQDRINEALQKALRQPTVIANLRSVGADATGSTIQAFSSDVMARFEKMREVVQSGKVVID
jgi:tripartite-type tricarboxylate transporter receptor subunit TctC